MSEKRRGRERTSRYLRLGAGAYLVYLAWGLFGEMAAHTASNMWAAGVMGAVFGVVGLALVAASARYLYLDFWKGQDDGAGENES